MENNDQVNKKSNKGVLVIVGVVVLVIAGWFIAKGMGKSIGGIDVDRNFDGSATYTTDDGTVTVGGNKLPDNWPSDAPKYPRANIQYSGSSNPQTGEAGAVIIFLTKDKKQAVVDFYKKELSSNGWIVEQTIDLGGISMLVSNKSERTIAVQVAEAENGEVNVTVSVSTQN